MVGQLPGTAVADSVLAPMSGRTASAGVEHRFSQQAGLSTASDSDLGVAESHPERMPEMVTPKLSHSLHGSSAMLSIPQQPSIWLQGHLLPDSSQVISPQALLDAKSRCDIVAMLTLQDL
jgi:hypothetical protein